MFVEEVASLHLMQWNYHVLEEDYVFLPQWYGETRNNAGQNVEKFGSPVELEGLVDERVEAVVDGLADHFTSGD